MEKHLKRIRKAYDLTVEQHNRGIDSLAEVPEEFKRSLEFKAFQEECPGVIAAILKIKNT
jgi:hypothetical protein